MCRARLSWRSPPRLSRCRIVWPLEAGTGATPASRAKAASERTRPWCDQATISCAATIGPTPGSSSSRGASARTWPRISRSSSCGLDGRCLDPAGEACAARASSPARRRWPSSSGGSGCSARAAAAPAARAARCAEPIGCGHDHAAQLHERFAGAHRRRCGARPAAAAAPPVARPSRASASVSLASAARAARTASSGSSLPRSRRSLRGAAAALEHRLAAAAQVTGEPGAVMPAPSTAQTRAPARARPRTRSAARNRARSPRTDRRATTAPVGAATTAKHVLVPVRVDTDDVVQLDLQASRPILRLRLVGSGDAGLSAGKPRGRTVMSHAHKGGQAPDQASSGRQTGAAVHTRTNHSQGTHQGGQSPDESQAARQTTRLATAPDRPTRRVSQSPEQ